MFRIEPVSAENKTCDAEITVCIQVLRSDFEISFGARSLINIMLLIFSCL